MALNITLQQRNLRKNTIVSAKLRNKQGCERNLVTLSQGRQQGSTHGQSLRFVLQQAQRGRGGFADGGEEEGMLRCRSLT